MMLMMLVSGISLDQCFRSIAKERSRGAPALPTHRFSGRRSRSWHELRRSAGPLGNACRGQRREGAGDPVPPRPVPGASSLPSLRDFIEEFTQRRIARARDAMGKIAVRMVVVMIVFFMPALFIVLGGPPVATLFDTLRGCANDPSADLDPLWCDIARTVCRSGILQASLLCRSHPRRAGSISS